VLHASDRASECQREKQRQQLRELDRRTFCFDSQETCSNVM
jgi:hypothetical protein